MLLIGLDAADPVLVDRWIGDGSLPHLGALEKSGVHGRLETSARYLAGSPWPTFYTGRPPDHHGIYHDFQWRHEQMGFARPSPEWLAATPFWRTLRDGVRVVAYDVPMTLGCEPFGGREVSGWASHDVLGPPSSHPAPLIDEIRSRFGTWPLQPEAFGRSPVEELLALRDELLANTRRSTEVALWLLERPWDLGIVVFGALHRGGHRLWDATSVEGEIAPHRRAEFDGALRELYVACDEAVGRLVASAPDATVIVFSVHGMMENTSRVDLLDDMLARVLRGPEAAAPRRSAVRRIGEALPLKWRRAATRAVPARLRDRMVTQWVTGGVDWSRTEAMALRADLHGYVRVNLEGREPRGIVAPRDFDALCDRISEGLRSFRDAATGEPIVEQVVRTRELYDGGQRAERLPDLVVRWPETSATPHASVTSERFGTIERATPGRIPNGRSGNHRPEGMFIARGPGIAPGRRIAEPADILDLAPTVLRELGATASAPLDGEPVPF